LPPFLSSPGLRLPVYAADSAKIKQLYDEDQSDRAAGPGKINWASVNRRDLERQQAVLEILKGGGLSTSNDYYHGAMVFQHASTAEGISLAHSLAVLASRIDPENSKAQWLAAASWDRLLMRKQRPQWYGTQFTKNSETGKWELYQIDEGAVTDDEREKSGVPSLAVARDRAKRLNGE